MWSLQRGPATIGSRVTSAGRGADGTRAPPNQLTNDGVVVSSEPACLDFDLEFHTILLRVRTFDSFGAWPHFAGSVHAPVGLTNDGVVVRVGTPGLDSGLKLHMIDSPFVSFLVLWVCLTSYMPETRVNER